jgi:hypothetical protein
MVSPKRTCRLEGCSGEHCAKGWCKAHYEQYKRGKAPSLDRSEYTAERGVCAATDCENTFPQRSIGSPRLYCSRQCRDRAEKQKLRANGWVAPHKRDGWPPCSIEGCDKPKMAKGLCPMHYERVKKHGTPGPAASKKRPGEWRTNKQGYVHRWLNGEHQLQHRFVMEQQLGRPLAPEENVHHRNGQRNDNSPENLELWVKPQPCGQRVEDLIAWVIELYPTYVESALTRRNSMQP